MLISVDIIYLRLSDIKCIIYGVTNLRPETCRRLREARREAGLSQSVLAAEIGCKQSALSMFEQGDGTKLNDEAIKKLCEKFGIELEQTASASGAEGSSGAEAVARPAVPGKIARGYCPNPACPSHTAYEVEGRRFLSPDRERQDPAGGKFCAVCGEVLEKKCPTCGAALHEGAVCGFCGSPYVAIEQMSK